MKKVASLVFKKKMWRETKDQLSGALSAYYALYFLVISGINDIIIVLQENVFGTVSEKLGKVLYNNIILNLWYSSVSNIFKKRYWNQHGNTCDCKEEM